MTSFFQKDTLAKPFSMVLWQVALPTPSDTSQNILRSIYDTTIHCWCRFLCTWNFATCLWDRHSSHTDAGTSHMMGSCCSGLHRPGIFSVLGHFARASSVMGKGSFGEGGWNNWNYHSWRTPQQYFGGPYGAQQSTSPIGAFTNGLGQMMGDLKG